VIIASEGEDSDLTLSYRIVCYGTHKR